MGKGESQTKMKTQRIRRTKNKMENETKQEQRNPWKVATIFLAGLCVFLFVMQFQSQKVFNEVEVCQSIRGTPAWISDDGSILLEGYKEFPSVVSDNNGQNYSINPVTEYLIKEKIHFVYATGCGWCDKQIEWFGEDNWNAYQEANLTHDCRAVLG